MSGVSDFPPIFRDHAHNYARLDISVLPCLGEDGKRPLIKNWQRAQPNWAWWMAKKFPQANIGFIDGNSITRVDVDDPSLAKMAQKRFGRTPVAVSTPSGGFHLWYKANGERRVIGLEGLKLDILGRGGYGIAPPSMNPSTGRRYQFVRGGLDDLGRLPSIKSGALPGDAYTATARPDTSAPSDAVITLGRRNKKLFVRLLRNLAEGINANRLDALADAWNETNCNPPMAAGEVAQIVSSALRYQREGRNFVGQVSRAQITAFELEALGGNGDAVLLLMKLRTAHGWRNGGKFALAKAMAATLGWTIPRFKKARSFLCQTGFLVLVHPGGNGTGDPPIYNLTEGV